MAGEIYVGAVAVGVVPDLKDFNDTMRRELVPSADSIGEEIGKEMSRGILDALNIGSIIIESAHRGVADIARAGDFAGEAFADGFKAKVDTELRGFTPTVHAKVDVDTSKARSDIEKLGEDVIPGIGGGGSGSGAGGSALSGGESAAGGAAGGIGAIFAGGIPGAISAIPGPALAGLGEQVALALPFIVQAVSGAVVTGFGAGIAGLAIYGAALSGKLTKPFDEFKKQAQLDIESIGQSFIPVIQNIIGVADTVLGELTPIFASAAGIIAGPFKLFADTLIEAFGSPAVQLSITAVANAFADILKAVTPQLPGMVNEIANGIISISDAVSEHPSAFADFTRGLIDIVSGALEVIAALTRVADWIEVNWDWFKWIAEPVPEAIVFVIDHFGQMQHDIADIYDAIRHNISEVWDYIHDDTVSKVVHINEDVQTQLNVLDHNIAGIFDDIRHGIAHDWDLIYDDTIGEVSKFYSAGEDIIQGLFSGISSAMSDVSGWIKTHVVDPLISAIKHWFGINSPATSTMPVGQNLIAGVIQGMLSSAGNLTSFMDKIFGGWPQALGSLVSKGLVDVAKLPEKALHALGSVASKIGGFFAKMFGGGSSGVTQWAGTVAQALAMLGLPLSLGSRVLYQMQTESGGNANAINLTDINAQMGDPSRGLMQVIGSTFATYHVPGTSDNIYDPLANIAAALNYATHVYGPDLMRGGMGIGSGHGYDSGGWLPPGIGVYANMTGRPEPVLNDRQWNTLQAAANGGASGPTYIANFDGLTGQAIEGHVRTAFHAMSLTQGHLNRQGRRS